MTNQEIENEIQSKGLTAPRVALADIEAAIAAEFYISGGQVNTEPGDKVYPDANAVMIVNALTRLTLCVLVLRNGFIITGEAAPVLVENFDPELGRKIARQSAIDKCWPLFGFALADRLRLAVADPSPDPDHQPAP